MEVADLSIRSEQNHAIEPSNSYPTEENIPNEHFSVKGIQPTKNGLIPALGGGEKSNFSTYEQNKFLKYLDDKNGEGEISSEWRDLANIMDRFFLLMYSLTTMIVTLAFMLQCAVN